MKRYALVLLCLLSSIAIHAGNPVSILKFEEGEQFSLTLSSLNFNRIDVEGERIIKVSYPEKAFLIERGKQDLDDLDGAVVLKPLAHIPLTLYFTTHRNHHFSVTVTPVEDLGKTIRFVAKALKGFDYVQENEKTSYQTSDLMTSMMEGSTPQGFKEVSIKPASFTLHKQLKVRLVKRYQGLKQSGYVYRIENQTNKPLELTQALFDNPKLIAMELSERHLAPHQGGYFYGIYKEIANIG